MSEENKALARRVSGELYSSRGTLDAADDIYAPDVVAHDPTAICRRTDLSKIYAASASFLAPEPQTFEVPQSGGSIVLRIALGYVA
jgi:hypothetical protein